MIYTNILNKQVQIFFYHLFQFNFPFSCKMFIFGFLFNELKRNLSQKFIFCFNHFLLSFISLFNFILMTFSLNFIHLSFHLYHLSTFGMVSFLLMFNSIRILQAIIHEILQKLNSSLFYFSLIMFFENINT